VVRTTLQDSKNSYVPSKIEAASKDFATSSLVRQKQNLKKLNRLFPADDRVTGKP